MLLSGLLGDGVKVSGNVLDPLARSLSSFLADSLLFSSPLLADLFLSGLTSFIVGLGSLLPESFTA